uniref:(California timema) hypothetical protein n=1 Tax=Timema californicum TaxID=61474 RepID=A0A7R9J1V3_TIMCA|nr:unnamed protein product [Timema californicum]
MLTLETGNVRNVVKVNFRVWWRKQALGAHVESTNKMCGTVAEIRYHTATIPLPYYYYSGTAHQLSPTLAKSDRCLSPSNGTYVLAATHPLSGLGQLRLTEARAKSEPQTPKENTVANLTWQTSAPGMFQLSLASTGISTFMPERCSLPFLCSMCLPSFPPFTENLFVYNNRCNFIALLIVSLALPEVYLRPHCSQSMLMTDQDSNLGQISDLFDDLMASVGMPPLKKIVTQSQTQITMSTQGSGDTNAEKLYSCHQYASKVIRNLNFLRQNTRFCDVAIVAGGNVMKRPASVAYLANALVVLSSTAEDGEIEVRISVHRAVLSASSPYFQAMFTAGLLEDQKDTIELHTIAPHILNSIVEFIYSGELKVFGIFGFADGHNCEELASVAMDFIQSHFPQICNEEEFFELPKDLLTKFLSSEHLRVDTEFQVLNVFWLKIGVLE